jgi:hypothetical protein
MKKKKKEKEKKKKEKREGEKVREEGVGGKRNGWSLGGEGKSNVKMCD